MSSAEVVNKCTGLLNCVEIHEMGTTVQDDADVKKGKKDHTKKLSADKFNS